MKHKTTQAELESLINSRLAMQSTERNLHSNYGIKTATLQYFKSKDFAEKYAAFTVFQRKGFLNTIAGPFNWVGAGNLIEHYHSTLV